MAEAWPANIPQSPMFDGASVSLEDNRIAFKPDRGRAIMRADSTVRDDDVTFNFLMRREELNAFLLWYKQRLGNGVKPYSYFDPTMSAAFTFLFKVPPTYAPVGPLTFKVNCQLKRYNS